MPRKFDANEKSQIQQKLLDAGRSLFSRYGFKKTNVSELAKAAGIASGTFYLFYRSKEELFFDLVEEEEHNIRQILLRQLQSAPKSKQAFRSFFKEAFRLLTDNPILREVLLPEQLEAIIRKLPPDRLERNYAMDVQKLTPLIRQWQADGVLRTDADPELIVSMMRTLLLLSLHKQAIGETVYEATADLLITVVADGLFAGNGAWR
ncbi:TetR family transcriptional regulator [Paenibacillus sp. 32O-W]|uniref:TetR/AcrR family transcriptional regulator n=1 Tax=Paenibacillus sp. 32O-W TaxID=1695218 RepID=UPI000721A4CE|nr:TetR/AcrR family transcriptional regulator [Paenibacillus sp. 32O-W]ALS26403.1 TetR family transcriptional regulator [Paenibacillus sp. 32O-W]